MVIVLWWNPVLFIDLLFKPEVLFRLADLYTFCFINYFFIAFSFFSFIGKSYMNGSFSALYWVDLWSPSSFVESKRPVNPSSYVLLKPPPLPVKSVSYPP